MNLYVVCNGWMGESYLRVYVWAVTAEQALQMAITEFEKDGRQYNKNAAYWDASNMEVKLLFSGDSAAFATKPSDSGFDL